MKIRTMIVPHQGAMLEVEFADDPSRPILKGRVVEVYTAEVYLDEAPPATRALPFSSRKQVRKNSSVRVGKRMTTGIDAGVKICKTLRSALLAVQDGKLTPEVLDRFERSYADLSLRAGDVLGITHSFGQHGEMAYRFAAWGIHHGLWKATAKKPTNHPKPNTYPQSVEVLKTTAAGEARQ
jgi:hypothetical protein